MKNIFLKLLPLSLAVVACGGNNATQNTTQAPAKKQDVLVEVQSAAYREVPQVSSYSSTVQAYAVNNIMPQQGGRIRKINVEVGDYVGKGQILAEMDRLQLDQLALQVQNDEIEYARLKSLYEEGGVSQSDFESLELAFKVSQSSYENLLENTILRAPVSGVVSARNYDRGDLYSMSQPIYTVQQITPVKLLVPISEADYTRVKRGDKVTLTADALPGKTYEGTIVRLYPTIDPASHTFSAEVRVANENRELRPGMYARVAVDFGSVENIVVPDAAVMKLQGSGQRTVFVLNDDNTVSMKTVETGRHFGNRYEILSGLEEGELVLTGGHSNLRSGDKVEVQR